MRWGCGTLNKTILIVLILGMMLSVATFSEVGYQQITQEEAVRIMEEETGYIILDVRTEEEYDEGHIPGAINIANEDIGTDELPELPDKDQVLLVYCRSGRRSKEASEKLAALGYTHVLEFGGIITWTGEVISTEEEEWEDDPFEAHEYGDPEDFYYDYYEEFDDYEEAEEYYYDHGGW